MATTAEGDFLWGATMQARARKLLLEYQERYVAANPKSADSFGRASVSLAGGNTRSVLHYDPFPMVLVSGRDCFVSSEDGREYVDFVSEYSACMLGHSHPAVAEAVQAVMSRGINLGGASKEEQVLAALLTERIPSMARVRFCNSGTEANTMALTLARHHTGRRKILAFENGYHGGFIGFDSGVLPTTVPFEFVLARYDDATHVRELVDDSFAAIIVEPMQGVGGMIPASRRFLQTLREVADATSAVLIFDEVVTSRLNYNALQSHHGVFPDLTTIGKFWGGGRLLVRRFWRQSRHHGSHGSSGARRIHQQRSAAAPEPLGDVQQQRLQHDGRGGCVPTHHARGYCKGQCAGRPATGGHHGRRQERRSITLDVGQRFRKHAECALWGICRGGAPRSFLLLHARSGFLRVPPRADCAQLDAYGPPREPDARCSARFCRRTRSGSSIDSRSSLKFWPQGHSYGLLSPLSKHLRQ